MELNLNVFDDYTKSSLIKEGLLTSKIIFNHTELELRKKANLTVSAARKVFIEASKISLLQQNMKISNQVITTGCEQIDIMLGGGLFQHGITELSGESGCGKTQFCLQAALTIQLPSSLKGAKSGAVYICTEDHFPSSRIQQMINNLPSKYQNNSKIERLEVSQVDFGDNILINLVTTVEDLKKCIYSMLPKVLNHKSIKLIVIDSIAAVFRGEYEKNEMHRRSKDLRDIACWLHKLSVTSSLSDIGGKNLVPSLGLSWANLVTTRLLMSKILSTRFLEVIFSPHAASKRIPFIVTDRGIEAREHIDS
ncbi:DNA repair protein XRCC3-like isoform X2 [Daktulosphaira vitifoliae]|uniref:DNA repair protein XRCC3-like isoform X2 n=1 Tax=Daktulosphaira vitifoliae TaxID=58002 RepID=UPI0021AA1A03|nr:DNA repair protein XRCC3-like isoform X2 [Daktulosphaira vitifoliae]